MIVIVDYGVGNLASIKNMLKKIGVACEISSDLNTVENASKLILPGVGSFDYGMQQLRTSGLLDVLHTTVINKKTPILGICLGLQLMVKSSEEGKEEGLGWVDAVCKKFTIDSSNRNLKIPHMDWTDINIVKESKLFNRSTIAPRFYFVHSYHLVNQKPSDTLCTAKYGYEFVCGVEKENIIGVQFHPEKSHQYGISLLKNFAEKY